jgi:hypothetical protein
MSSTKIFKDLDKYLLQINEDRFRSIEDLPLNNLTEKRYDTKLIINEKTALNLLARLHNDWKFIKVDNIAEIEYETFYFDTPDFQFFKDHKQGRRKRFKIRIRTYETGDRYLELKFKTNIEETRKIRWSYPKDGSLTTLNSKFLHLITERLELDGYKINFHKLEYKLSTKYRRVSLVNFKNNEKITLDKNLTVQKNNRTKHIGNDYMILEVKSQKLSNTLRSSLNLLHQNRIRLSKYGLAVPILYPEMGANPWSLALKKFSK